MKYLIFLCTLLSITACVSSKMALRNGNYSEAVDIAWKKLMRDAGNQDEIKNIELAYAKAQQSDMGQIEFLKKEGNPQNWDQIYDIYMAIRRRQVKVQALPELVIKPENRKVIFATVNVDDELIKSKQNAAAYSYAHALQMLNSNTKANARKAFYEFEQVKKYYSSYKDVDSLMQIAQSKGIAYVLISAKNKSFTPIDPAITEELLRIDVRNLDDEWMRFDTRETEGKNYDYMINITIKGVNVSMPTKSFNNYRESKQVQDGLDFKYDKEGNIVTDTAGHPVKIPKYKIIVCDVREIIELRSAVINGIVEFIDLHDKHVIESQGINAEHVFENHYAVVNGDLNAASENTLALMHNPSMMPPPAGAMIEQCIPILKDQSMNAIRTHKDLLE